MFLNVIGNAIGKPNIYGNVSVLFSKKINPSVLASGILLSKFTLLKCYINYYLLFLF